MLLDMVSDTNNKVLVNHSKSYALLDPLNKIHEIFLFTKNQISFHNSKQIEKASETLVYRYGNNISKNILLYSLLKINKFECTLVCSFIKDTNNLLKESKFKVIPWIYVKVTSNYKTLYLDCSFDKYFLHRINLFYTGDKLNYLPNDYFLSDQCAFEVIHTLYDLEDLNILNYFYKDNYNIYNKEYCYV